MATDRREQIWKLHKDPEGILAGMKNREFMLRSVGTIGSNKVYDLLYERKSGDKDPFAGTKFYLFGGKEIAAPVGPRHHYVSSNRGGRIRPVRTEPRTATQNS